VKLLPETQSGIRPANPPLSSIERLFTRPHQWRLAVMERNKCTSSRRCRLICIVPPPRKNLGSHRFAASSAGSPRPSGHGNPHGLQLSEYAARGALAAYDARYWQRTWRFLDRPGDPERLRNQRLEMAAKTWSAKASWKIGGGDALATPSL